jgi:hypothetical protein
LDRQEAAQLIGVGSTLFGEMVADGRMPLPKCINSRRVWSRIALEHAFNLLPDDSAADYDNPWDRI